MTNVQDVFDVTRRPNGISQADISNLQAMLDSGNRGNVYIQLYIWTGNTQYLEQSQITTYSGFFGGAALVGNAAAKLDNPNKYNITLDAFSKNIVQGQIDALRFAVENHQNTLFDADKIQDVDRDVWVGLGLGDYFPGNIEYVDRLYDSLSIVASQGTSNAITAGLLTLLAGGLGNSIDQFPEGDQYTYLTVDGATIVVDRTSGRVAASYDAQTEGILNANLVSFADGASLTVREFIGSSPLASELRSFLGADGKPLDESSAAQIAAVIVAAEAVRNDMIVVVAGMGSVNGLAALGIALSRFYAVAGYGFCFLEGTPILLASGAEKRIEEIVTGDLVQSFNAHGDIVAARVQEVYRGQTSEYLELSNGLRVTAGHRFLCPDGRFEPIEAILANNGEVVDVFGNSIAVFGRRHRATAEINLMRGGRALSLSKERAFPTFNFAVENTHTYIAGGLRVHNEGCLEQGEYILGSKVDENGNKIIFATNDRGDAIRVVENVVAGHTETISKTVGFKSGDADVLIQETWRRDLGQIGSNGQRLGDGDLSIPDWNGHLINGQQIGGILGSALGNYLGGGNVFARVVYGSVLDSVFTSVGKTFDVYAGGFSHRSGVAVDSFGESADIAFRDFDNRLAGSFVSAGIGEISSFIVGNIIGGQSLAADFARVVGNSFVSAALSKAAADVFPSLAGTLATSTATSEASALGVGFNPYTAIASFLGSELSNALISPDSQGAAIMANVLGSLGATIGSAWGPIGIFVGQFIGETFGALLGNTFFADDDYPRAMTFIDTDANGNARLRQDLAVGFDEMPASESHDMGQAMVDALNTLIDRLGPNAKLVTNPGGGDQSGMFMSVGYIVADGYRGAEEGYVIGRYDSPQPSDPARASWWNQVGFEPGDFQSGIDFAFKELIAKKNFTGADGYGLRIIYYSDWSNYEELLVNLKVADDYRNYLANKDVIDALMAEAPNSQFTAGWIITLAQVTVLGLSNPYALQNKIVGSAAAETLTGDSQFNDEIIGGAGNDTLLGLAGNDLLTGGAGADVLDGGDGIDTAGYVDSSAAVFVNLATGAASGGDAAGDTLISIERLFGSAFADTLIGDAGDNVLAGMAGNDTLNGGEGDDLIEGGAGADTMDGGAGYDIANYAGSTVGVKVWLQEGTTLGGGLGGDAEGDTLTGFEAISGSLYSDILIGNSEDNLLVGGAGNDFLEGRGGADKLIGGDGSDFADYHASGAAIQINLATGTASGGDAEGDQFSSIENVIGSAFADTIIGDAGGNIIEGGAGADILDGGAGMDVLSYASSSAGVNVNLLTNVVSGGDAEGDIISNFEHVIGSAFNDVIVVGSPDAIVLAGAGDDVIVPYSGNARIDGGEGYDTVSFINVDKAGFFTGLQRGGVEVYQGSDIYAVWDATKAGGSVTAAMFAGDRYTFEINSIEWLRATEFDDIISFNDINQYVFGGGGNDIMMGREGNDTFDGGDGNDELSGGLGDDDLRGGAGDDIIHGEGTVDTYQPFAGFAPMAHYITNPDGSQTLAPPPVLPAGGNDRLDGGAGNDALYGGGGNDTYVFGRGYGQDTVEDYDYKLVNAISTGKVSLPIYQAEVIDGGVDTLEFAAGIRPEDIFVMRSGNDLVVSIRDTKDKITLQNWMSSYGKIEKFYFAETGHTFDFTDWTAASVVSFFATGTTNESQRFDGNEWSGIITGGAGRDTVDYRNASGAVSVDITLGGSQGAAAGDSYTSIENVVGSAFADTITGNAADNVIEGGAGGDTLNGGDGFDFVSYASSQTGVVVRLPEGGSTIQTPILYFDGSQSVVVPDSDAVGDYLTGFEGIIGSAFDDFLTGSSGNNVLEGGKGNDTLAGAEGNDTYRYNAGDGYDRITDIQTIVNFKNPDTYASGGTDDVLEFGAGISISDIVLATVAAGFAVNIYDDASSYSATSTLLGQIAISNWSDIGRIEHFHFANGLVVDTANIGKFDLTAAAGNPLTVTNGTGIWKVANYATAFGNTNLAGTVGNDVLIGGFANDSISGGNGDDILVGGKGNDSLTGGGGYDRAVFEGSIAGFSITKSGTTWTVTDIDPSNGDLGTDTLTTIEEVYFDDARLKLDGTNNAPIARGNVTDQTANEDVAFTYVVPSDAFIDPGDTLTYSATLQGGSGLPSWLSFNATTRTFSGTPTNADVGVCFIKVVATDAALANGSSTFILNVTNVNNAPVAVMALSDQAALEASAFSYVVPSGAFTDFDAGDTLTYSAKLADGSALPNWLSFDAATRTFSGTPGIADAGSLTVKVIATDSSSASVSTNFALTVTRLNHTPTVAMSIASQSVDEDASFNFTIPTGTFTDADASDSLTYVARLEDGSALPSWLSFSGATKTFSGTPTNADVGSITVTVTATDTMSSSVSSSFSLTVINTNDAPVAAMVLSSQNAMEDSAFSYTIPSGAITDVDIGDTLTYAAVLADGSALPAWLSFNAETKTFTGTPTHGDVGNLTIKIVATDAAGETATSNFSLNVAHLNHAPVAAIALAAQSVNEDAIFTYVLPIDAFTDIDEDDALTYTATLADGSALPSWLSFNAATRSFSGTPLNADVGNYTIKVKATDGASAFASSTFVLAVANTNDAPVAAMTLANQTAAAQAVFSYTVPVGAFTDVDVGDVLTYSATLADGSALPSWLSFNATTRTLSGTPPSTIGGVYTIKVKVTDSASATATSNFTLTVTAGSGNDVLDGVVLSGLLDGGPGIDTVTYATATAGVTVNLATGVGAGAAAGDTYVNIEQIIGSEYADTLIGNAGNNILWGRGGADTLDGGGGYDWAYYADATSGITATLNGGTGFGTVTVAGVTDTLAGIEGIVGSLYDDTFTGSANSDTFYGYGGVDSASGGAGNDTYYAAANGRLNIFDQFIANTQTINNGKLPSSAYTLGDAGSDTLIFMNGISLDDILATQVTIISSGLNLTFAADTISTSTVDTTADNGVNIAGWFSYQEVMNTVTNPNSTYMRIETFVFADGLTFSAAGISSVSTDMSDVSSTFTGTAADEWYSARGGNDILNGNGGNDVLIGGSGDDTINGGAGNDVLSGGTGNDTLTGGAGFDLYSFGRGDGMDIVSQTGADASGGKLFFGEGIRADQLWFKQVGLDLEVSVIGTTDKISITGFFSSGTREITEFDAGGLKLNTASSSTAVSQLVSAMASFSPPAVGTLDLPSAIRNDTSVSAALAAWAA